MNKTNFDLGIELVKIYRAWHQLEQDNKSGLEIIDMDLAPLEWEFSKNPFSVRGEVTEALARLQKNFDTSLEDGEFLVSRIEASIQYCKALEGKGLDFDQYVESTLGVKPQWIDEAELDQLKNEITEALAELGYKFSRDGWKKFVDDNALSEDEIETSFLESQKKFLPMVSDFIDENIVPEYELRFVSKDDYWINWISHGKSGFLFQVNTHSKMKNSWYKGIIEVLAIHEMGGHLLQASCWKKNVADGNINPGFGVTIIPGPETWNQEGMADNLPFLNKLMFEELTDFGKFAFQFSHYSQSIRNNIHILVNEKKLDTEKVMEYYDKYLPNVTQENAKSSIKQRRESAYHSSYLYSYSDGGRYHFDLSKDHSERELQAILKRMYFSPMTPPQIKLFVKQLDG